MKDKGNAIGTLKSDRWFEITVVIGYGGWGGYEVRIGMIDSREI